MCKCPVNEGAVLVLVSVLKLKLKSDAGADTNIGNSNRAAKICLPIRETRLRQLLSFSHDSSFLRLSSVSNSLTSHVLIGRQFRNVFVLLAILEIYIPPSYLPKQTSIPGTANEVLLIVT